MHIYVQLLKFIQIFFKTCPFCVAMVERSQSAIQIRHYTVIEVKELLDGSSTRLPVLNTDSEVTVEIGIANTSRAILKRMVNLSLLTF